MTTTKALFVIGFGVAMELIAFMNTHFYWRKCWFSGDKEAPRWAGRALFGVGGALFIVLGLVRLIWDD